VKLDGRDIRTTRPFEPDSRSGEMAATIQSELAERELLVTKA
jgi:hypothetical protein